MSNTKPVKRSAHPVDAEAAKVIANYTPRGLSPETWTQVSPSVRELVLRSEPCSVDEASNRMTAMSGLIAVAVADRAALDLDSLFGPAMRSRHEAQSSSAPITRKRVRSRLDLLAVVHRDGHPPKGRRDKKRIDPPSTVGLQMAMADPDAPEAVLRFCVAALGAGLAPREAARARLAIADGRASVELPGSRSRVVTGEAAGVAMRCAPGPLLTAKQRDQARRWFAARDVPEPTGAEVRLAWLAEIGIRPTPTAVAMRTLTLNRRDLGEVACLDVDLVEAAEVMRG